MWHKVALIANALIFLGLVTQRVWYYSATTPAIVEHGTGAHAGRIVALGADQYHAEAVFTKDGLLKLYTLDRDGRRTREVEVQTLTAYLTPLGDTESYAMAMRPEPQTGDQPGNTSLFCGSLPAELAGQSVGVSIPNLCIGAERFHLTFDRHGAGQPDMPDPVPESEERTLHLVPGGKYTWHDVEANGRTIPSQKYRGFQAVHDHEPKPGDQLCPVTRTKANPSCTWVIGGRVHQFCCPPCIDEFVRIAKEQPEKAKPPGEYVHR